ncbi:MAG: hypothetical protein ACXWVT_12080 [Burkholderiaceae bacterium]
MNWSTLLSTSIGELLGRKKEQQRRREASKPAIGATLCCAGLRMTVQAGLSEDLWQWLVKLGWRELQPRENRLHFKPLPTTLVTRLFDCQEDERERILLAAIRQAASGSSTRVVLPPRLPARVS